MATEREKNEAKEDTTARKRNNSSSRRSRNCEEEKGGSRGDDNDREKEIHRRYPQTNKTVAQRPVSIVMLFLSIFFFLCQQSRPILHHFTYLRVGLWRAYPFLPWAFLVYTYISFIILSATLKKKSSWRCLPFHFFHYPCCSRRIKLLGLLLRD